MIDPSAPEVPVRIPERIVYLLHMNGWTEKELGGRLASEQPLLPAVEQWQISRWKLDKEKPPRVRIKQIEQLCYQTVLDAFESPKGLRMDQYLHKPFSGAELTTMVRKRAGAAAACSGQGACV
jgi:hypothetical protein